MADVTPLNPNAPGLEHEDMLELINQTKWAYRSEYGVAPSYLVIGGNPLLLLLARLRRVQGYANASPKTLSEVQGMAVVVVKRDALECGE